MHRRTLMRMHGEGNITGDYFPRRDFCQPANHDIPGRPMTVNDGDGCFAEAIGKLRGEKLLF